jgi:choline dehydrogenase
MNACMVVAGSPADYDEWGDGWSYAEIRPHLERARLELRTAPANTDDPTPFQAAFMEAARAAGLPRLAHPDDDSVGFGPFPANVVDGRRWSAALAYLEPARRRPNLTIAADSLVDRVLFDGSRATGVATADGSRLEAATVVLAAGAYFSPTLLMRSGIGQQGELGPLGIPVREALPVGENLRDHCGTDAAWELTPAVQRESAAQAREGELFEAHAFVKAASTSCTPGSWDLHLLPWIYPTGAGEELQVSVIVFHMKPLSSGRVTLRSTRPDEAPLVQRAFLTRAEDVPPLVEGIELARSIASTEPLRELLARELAPAAADPEPYVRETVRNYFHPVGTCAIGAVVSGTGQVLGVDGLFVADASIMPTIPRANTNLTTAAIAERIAKTL